MVDIGTLFPLVLTALTFVLIGMFFLVYLRIIGEREKNERRARLEAFGDTADAQGCYHFFGYLYGYPQDEPIPDECFGCPKAIECMSHQSETDSNMPEAVEQAQQLQEAEQAEQ